MTKQKICKFRSSSFVGEGHDIDGKGTNHSTVGHWDKKFCVCERAGSTDEQMKSGQHLCYCDGKYEECLYYEGEDKQEIKEE